MSTKVHIHLRANNLTSLRVTWFFLLKGWITIDVNFFLVINMASTISCLFLLLNELCLDSSIDNFESILELLCNLFVCRCWPLQPRMGYDFHKHWSVLRRVMKHLAYQIFEFRREKSCFFHLLMRFPKHIYSIDREEFVNHIIRNRSMIERKGSTSHYK